jgi:outer membrane lipoprotein-sorting protein
MIGGGIVHGSRRVLRWLVPAVAASVVVGGGAAAGTIVAKADPSLPERSAAQLLADMRGADVAGLSGTIVQSADLGLPAVPGLAEGTGGAADLAGLLTGTTTARVWHAGPDRERLSLLSAGSQTDVIRDGPDVWLWSSDDRKASHLRVPDAGGLPVTPGRAAAAALALIGPATEVRAAGVTEVAGRAAYELVLRPDDPVSLIGRVSLAVDAERHVPLRVDVYARNAATPAARVAFQQISFAVPEAGQFAFNPPPGTIVTRGDAGKQGLSVIGEGWAAVLSTRLPAGAGIRRGLWTGSLVSVLITEDGTVYAGPVTAGRLREAAAR